MIIINAENYDAETKESYAIHLIIFRRNHFQTLLCPLAGLS